MISSSKQKILSYWSLSLNSWMELYTFFLSVKSFDFCLFILFSTVTDVCSKWFLFQVGTTHLPLLPTIFMFVSECRICMCIYCLLYTVLVNQWLLRWTQSVKWTWWMQGKWWRNQLLFSFLHGKRGNYKNVVDYCSISIEDSSNHFSNNPTNTNWN